MVHTLVLSFVEVQPQAPFNAPFWGCCAPYGVTAKAVPVSSTDVYTARNGVYIPLATA